MDRSTLRIALRTLTRHKGFTVVAVLSIAVAIALNSVMYSTLDALINPQIDARQPRNVYSFAFYGNVNRQSVTADQIEEALRAGARDFEGVSGHYPMWNVAQVPLVENGPRYRRVTPRVVRPNYFDFLGTMPLEGRTFRESDAAEGSVPVVISRKLADHLFPNESPIGRTLLLDGTGVTVIGVVRSSATFAPLGGDVWILRQPGQRAVPVNIIRFTREIDQYEMDKQLELAAARLSLAVNDPTKWAAFRGKPFETQQFRYTRFHWALGGAVLAVLLVACANLANLQLARGLARTRELALRSAVGASRRQLVTLLVLESGVLAVAGLVLGVVLTLWGVHIVRASIPEEISRILIQPQLSWRVFAFAAAAAVACLLLVGLVPSLRISRVDPNDLLKSGAGTGANREHRRRYGLMVVAQIGFALPVLVGAIVVLRSAWQLASPEVLLARYGYDARPIVAAHVPFRPAPGKVIRLGDVAAQVSALASTVPGVQDVAAIGYGRAYKSAVTVDDENGEIREMMAHQWSHRIVSPNYFRTVGQVMERGRDFIDGEFDGRYVILDAPSARFLWGNRDPVGRSIKFGNRDFDGPWHQVVGIVKDRRDTATIRRADYTTGFRLAGVYRVMTALDSLVLADRYPAVNLLVRVQGNTELAAVRLQRQLRTMAGTDAPGVMPITDEIGLTARRAQQEFVASLFSTFAFLGLCLVAIGVYGIVSHSVAERRRELGVRIALGATARDILRATLREGNALILAGVAVGLLFTKYTVFWLGQFISDDDGYNAILFALISAVLFGIAAFAAFIPAWRATRIDPVEALRHE